MRRILLMNGDSVSLRAMQIVLERASYEVACCQDAASGVVLLPQFAPDVVVIDLQLLDISGIDALRVIRMREAPPPCIFITRFGHDQEREEAIRLGAAGCIDQPLTPGLLLTVVHNAVSGSTDGQEQDGADESHALGRWADLVVRGVHSPKDMPTLLEWGRAVGLSKGGLRNWCYTARLSPRHSLQFMRVLRAVTRQGNSSLSAEDLLDIVDRRTLAKLLILAGGTSTELPKNVLQFFDRQRIVQNPRAVRAVRAALCMNRSATMLAASVNRSTGDGDVSERGNSGTIERVKTGHVR